MNAMVLVHVPHELGTGVHCQRPALQQLWYSINSWPESAAGLTLFLDLQKGRSCIVQGVSVLAKIVI